MSGKSPGTAPFGENFYFEKGDKEVAHDYGDTAVTTHGNNEESKKKEGRRGPVMKMVEARPHPHGIARGVQIVSGVLAAYLYRAPFRRNYLGFFPVTVGLSGWVSHSVYDPS